MRNQLEDPGLYISSNFKDALAKVEKAEKALEKANDKLKEEKSKTLVKCFTCGALSSISELKYIQTHWYEQPYSCNGGDMWHQGEGQFMCSNGHINRLYNRKEVEEYKYLFKSIEETY